MAGIQRNSYYYQNHRQSEALIRARRPYLVKNAITGIGIAAFAAAVYVYTIKAVGQDEFEDVKVPDSPVPQTKAAKH
ncbi:hypothetical protein UCRPA7_7233 [Phaeoacremonium minimum UCRPA7]|uniref:Cytochrome c oxidase assembly factor 3 n=1 Tax=Phaeoacremonium minimum (strain UCR-PA7) TaxID=1286976 RepID=R8BDA0_PHAM7|nr:hypothetical protein UCRPA7_7233 [Phaeoacremonium minimum UCRPA7]EON97271.1 hypothetical protein UCRPA7_7233 [Phaeoacremonium minimum UCRPA7]